MELAPEENQRALQIKQTVEQRSDILNLRDMEYAQFAVMTKGNVVEAIRRIQLAHAFRQEYNIDPYSLEQGMDLVEKFMQQQPNFLLSIDRNAAHGYHIFVYNRTGFHPSNIRSDEDYRIFIGAMIFMMDALQPTLQACQRGIVHIGECSDMQEENLDLQLEERLWFELMDFYPISWKEVSWLRTNTVASILYASMMRWYRPEHMQAFQLNFQQDEGVFFDRLDNLFKQSPPENAVQIRLDKIRGFLEERKRNMDTFSLEFEDRLVLALA